MHLTRMYDNFIANVTHELKSPLSSIQLYLETLYTRELPQNKKQEFLNLMINDAHRLDNLINSILDISGREQKKIPQKYTVYDCARIIPELLYQAKYEFKLPDSAVRISCETDCQCVLDKKSLQIAINNLFDNAIKYSPKPPKITIKVNQGPKYFYISFSDEGIGILPKEQSKIFNKFERIYDRHSPNVTGTGLGLYWVQQIIKAHGGNISVYSKGKNKGTTFKIALPIYRATKKRYINYLLKVTKQNVQSIDGEYED
jgi:two-component system phosphate regulon sensor histidine kinase PhoR